MKPSLRSLSLWLILLAVPTAATAASVVSTKASPVGSIYDPGCGPRSAASLLRWWQDVRGVEVFEGEAGLPTSALLGDVQRAERELTRDMRSFNALFAMRLPGGQRATWPWEYTSGLNAYLKRHGIALRAQGVYGTGLAERDALLGKLRDRFARGEPVVALVFAPNVQHYGRLKDFEVDERGDVWGVLANPVRSTRGDIIKSINLTGPTSLVSGVFWLEPTV